MQFAQLHGSLLANHFNHSTLYFLGEGCLGNEDEMPHKFIVKNNRDANEACITDPGVNAGVVIIKKDERFSLEATQISQIPKPALFI